MRILLILISLLAGASAQAQLEGTLKKIADGKTITLGYRTQAAPFSYQGPDGQPDGYSVELCKRVVASVEQQLKIAKLALRWVPVTAENRVSQVTSGAIDIECGTTTVTLGRQEQVDFSNLVFVDGGSFVSRADGPRKISELAGKRIGVLAGSTTESRLRATLKERQIEAQLVVLADEREGVTALTDKRIDAFANDRLALVGRVAIAGATGNFQMSEEDFSFEPYALMLRRDAPFRLAVNRALAQVYRSSAIVDIYNQWFAPLGRPGVLLSSMYYLNSIGE